MGYHIDIPHTQYNGAKGQCQSVRTEAPLVVSTHLILIHIQVGQDPHPLAGSLHHPSHPPPLILAIGGQGLEILERAEEVWEQKSQ